VFHRTALEKYRITGGRWRKILFTLPRDYAIVATLGEKNLRKSLGSSLFTIKPLKYRFFHTLREE
jgi:hypothetical protein